MTTESASTSIYALHDEAASAGDTMQMALCQLAIGGFITQDTMDQLCSSERRSLADKYGIGSDGRTQDVTADARAERECLRAIDHE